MALALDLYPTHRRMETNPVLLDHDTCQVVGPNGRRGMRLAGMLLAIFEMLLRRPGAVVRSSVMVDALWTDEQLIVDPPKTAARYTSRLRDALEDVGWPRGVIAYLDGVGWYLDTDEVARVIREARGE